ncbi:MAG: hypothetical protein Q7J04_03520, partial [Microcella sp.]|nr:hypothetical protein [Microcella sp.]
MVDDELPPDAEADSPPPAGPRRSTFTPPSGGFGYDPATTDDDALASALAQQLPQWTVPRDTAVVDAAEPAVSVEPPEPATPSAPSAPSAP